MEKITQDRPICYNCKHFIGVDVTIPKCFAFINGIPDEIFYESGSHNKPKDGQGNDIVFEQKK